MGGAKANTMVLGVDVKDVGPPDVAAIDTISQKFCCTEEVILK